MQFKYDSPSSINELAFERRKKHYILHFLLTNLDFGANFAPVLFTTEDIDYISEILCTIMHNYDFE